MSILYIQNCLKMTQSTNKFQAIYLHSCTFTGTVCKHLIYCLMQNNSECIFLMFRSDFSMGQVLVLPYVGRPRGGKSECCLKADQKKNININTRTFTYIFAKVLYFTINMLNAASVNRG